MTDQQIRELGPAFSDYVRQYRDCFPQRRTAGHFDNYCRGLLSDLPRKSVEPIALACGTSVRTLQSFLVASEWECDTAAERLRCVVGDYLDTLPRSDLGTVGVIDETSCRKQGDRTPGVQRQYLGCVGKVENGIVTVHLGVSRGRFQTLLDADLFLPESWSDDRDRCREAGIPDSLVHRPKWRIALQQVARANASGIRFDWLTFDEGYGSCPEFLCGLDDCGQRFVAEVPVSFSVRPAVGAESVRADVLLPGMQARFGTRVAIDRATTAPQHWRAVTRRVRVRDRWLTLIAAVGESTGEVKYFATNSTDPGPDRVLKAAFRRATVEHCFRLAKSEAGLSHFEGRSYVGLMRHMILTLIVLGFVSVHADRLRGEKSARNRRAGVPRAQRQDGGAVPKSAWHEGGSARRGGDPLPPAPQRAGRQIPQEKTA